jgi:integrase
MELENINHLKVKEWLSEFVNHSTRRNYEQNLSKFLRENNLSIEELINIESSDLKHKIMQYRANMLHDKKSQNSFLAIKTSVSSFRQYLDKPLKFRTNQIGKGQMDIDSHAFSTSDLKAMFEVGTTQGKAIISTAVSLGWEISQFIELERDHIKQVLDHAKENNEQFIYFQNTRNKTNTPRLGILNPLAIYWLNRYLETRKDKSKYLFGSWTQNGLSKYVKRMAKDANITQTGQIRFHSFRRWLMSNLSRASFNEFEIKFILGKSINISDLTYLQGLRSAIEEKYPKAYETYLNINPNTNGNGKIKELNNDMTILKEKLYDKDLEIDRLKKVIETNQENQSKINAEMISFINEYRDILKNKLSKEEKDELKKKLEG